MLEAEKAPTTASSVRLYSTVALHDATQIGMTFGTTEKNKDPGAEEGTDTVL